MRNAIGKAKGTHKIMGNQIAVMNLPAAERFKPENIFLVAACRAEAVKRHGMSRVLCGVDDDGKQIDNVCLSNDMKELRKGVVVELPDDASGGMRLWRIVSPGVNVASCDWLGNRALGPFMETPSAHHFCNQCTFNRSKPGAYRPLSFLRTLDPKRGVAKRDEAQVLAGHPTSLTFKLSSDCACTLYLTLPLTRVQRSRRLRRTLQRRRASTRCTASTNIYLLGTQGAPPPQHSPSPHTTTTATD